MIVGSAIQLTLYIGTRYGNKENRVLILIRITKRTYFSNISDFHRVTTIVLYGWLLIYFSRDKNTRWKVFFLNIIHHGISVVPTHRIKN